MKTSTLTGIQLFLRYAWPCAKTRLQQGKIVESDFDRLQYYVETNTEPNIALIEKCFPNAISEYDLYLTAFGGQRWSVDTVMNYWRHHHNHSHVTPILPPDLWCAMAVEIGSDIVHIRFDNMKLPVENWYKLPIKIGDMVFVHEHVVVEIA